MQTIVRAGVDLAKNVLQVQAVDAQGPVVTNRAIQRSKFLAWCAQLPAGCLVAMEACGGAHQWCRQLLRMGLDARMMAAALVAPYRMQGKSSKNDANDAAAICEATSRPQMRFVPVKTPEYNNGVPGVFKNGIDWLSRSDMNAIFAKRPTGIIGASMGDLARCRLRPPGFPPSGCWEPLCIAVATS